ncbi:TRAP transporter small permease [Nitratireductor sp. StC3]|uniref:TRAP transporter small permease subunit n=1 Tax=Nitratireductor sp. StC3 TaxID=2126741 RepID=UPI000D0D1ADA|nr:TRAP transporter small permease [Nitratireductor sp. StC3]PSM15790.1 hypothetical protein C7T96_23650 [Nitratireductor sp. StC3]
MSPPGPMSQAGKKTSFWDRFSAGIATVSSFLLGVMAIVVSYEVGSRYFLGQPTIWAWDVNVQLMMAIVMLGLADVYRRDMHIRVDVLTGRLGGRARAWLDILYAPLLLFIALTILWTGWEYFFKAFSRGQHASTLFAPPLWPIKFLLPVSGALLAVQIVAKFVRDLRVALGRAGA